MTAPTPGQYGPFPARGHDSLNRRVSLDVMVVHHRTGDEDHGLEALAIAGRDPARAIYLSRAELAEVRAAFDAAERALNMAEMSRARRAAKQHVQRRCERWRRR